MKISQLIHKLAGVMEYYGDIPVVIDNAEDQDGPNVYLAAVYYDSGIISDPKGFPPGVYQHNPCVNLYPSHLRQELVPHDPTKPA